MFSIANFFPHRFYVGLMLCSSVGLYGADSTNAPADDQLIEVTLSKKGGNKEQKISLKFNGETKIRHILTEIKKNDTNYEGLFGDTDYKDAKFSFFDTGKKGVYDWQELKDLSKNESGQISLEVKRTYTFDFKRSDNWSCYKHISCNPEEGIRGLREAVKNSNVISDFFGEYNKNVPYNIYTLDPKKEKTSPVELGKSFKQRGIINGVVMNFQVGFQLTIRLGQQSKKVPLTVGKIGSDSKETPRKYLSPYFPQINTTKLSDRHIYILVRSRDNYRVNMNEPFHTIRDLRYDDVFEIKKVPKPKKNKQKNSQSALENVLACGGVTSLGLSAILGVTHLMIEKRKKLPTKKRVPSKKKRKRNKKNVKPSKKRSLKKAASPS